MTTEVSTLPDTFIDGPESLGTPGDAAATSLAVENSAFALLKGICRELGVPAGDGSATVNTARAYGDPLETLGEMSDAAATDTGRQTAISLLKGVAAGLGV